MTASSNSPLERLKALGLELPATAAPVANYLPYVRAGELLFVSGQLPIGAGGTIDPAHRGQLGDSVTLEAGQAAAARAALNVLAQAHKATGNLAKLRMVRLGGFVNSSPDYDKVPQVVNGASDLFVSVLGDAGKHARFAVGVAQLPLNAAVEIEAILQIME